MMGSAEDIDKCKKWKEIRETEAKESKKNKGRQMIIGQLNDRKIIWKSKGKVIQVCKG